MEPKDIENPIAEEDFRSQIIKEKYKELAEKYKLYFALIKDSEQIIIQIIALENEIKFKSISVCKHIFDDFNGFSKCRWCGTSDPNEE